MKTRLEMKYITNNSILIFTEKMKIEGSLLCNLIMHDIENAAMNGKYDTLLSMYNTKYESLILSSRAKNKTDSLLFDIVKNKLNELGYDVKTLQDIDDDLIRNIEISWE